MHQCLKRTRNLGKAMAATCVLAVSITIAGVPRAAALEPESCSRLMQPLISRVEWLRVIGSRVTARGSLGYASFMMHADFQIEKTPLHTAQSVRHRETWLHKNSRNAFHGQFAEVFTDRGNGHEEKWHLWVGSNGAVQLRSITWNGRWTGLQNAQCYRDRSRVVMTGNIEANGIQFWTFLFRNWRPGDH